MGGLWKNMCDFLNDITVNAYEVYPLLKTSCIFVILITSYRQARPFCTDNKINAIILIYENLLPVFCNSCICFKKTYLFFGFPSIFSNTSPLFHFLPADKECIAVFRYEYTVSDMPFTQSENRPQSETPL